MNMEDAKRKGDELAARLEARKNETRDAFMNNQTTKLLMALIPASEPPEALATLLRAAHDGGFEHGAAMCAMEMIKAQHDAMGNGG